MFSTLIPYYNKVADRLLQPCSPEPSKLILVIFCSSPFAMISQWLTASIERDQRGEICRQYDNKTCQCALAPHRVHIAAVAAIDLIPTQSGGKKNTIQEATHMNSLWGRWSNCSWQLSLLQRSRWWWFVSRLLCLLLSIIRCLLRVHFFPCSCADIVLEWAIWLQVVCLFRANYLFDWCMCQQSIRTHLHPGHRSCAVFINGPFHWEKLSVF